MNATRNAGDDEGTGMSSKVSAVPRLNDADSRIVSRVTTCHRLGLRGHRTHGMVPAGVPSLIRPASAAVTSPSSACRSRFPREFREDVVRVARGREPGVTSLGCRAVDRGGRPGSCCSGASRSRGGVRAPAGRPREQAVRTANGRRTGAAQAGSSSRQIPLDPAATYVGSRPRRAARLAGRRLAGYRSRGTRCRRHLPGLSEHGAAGRFDLTRSGRALQAARGTCR